MAQSTAAYRRTGRSVACGDLYLCISRIVERWYGRRTGYYDSPDRAVVEYRSYLLVPVAGTILGDKVIKGAPGAGPHTNRE